MFFIPLVSSRWLFQCGFRDRRATGPRGGRLGLQTESYSAGTVSSGLKTAALQTASLTRTCCSLERHTETQDHNAGRICGLLTWVLGLLYTYTNILYICLICSGVSLYFLKKNTVAIQNKNWVMGVISKTAQEANVETLFLWPE